MLFSGIPFLYWFLPCMMLCAFVIRGKSKNLILLLFSLFFYAWGESVYIVLMMASILLGYIEGLFIARIEPGKKRKIILFLSCAVHVCLLAYFKYAGFLTENLHALGMPIKVLKIALPIGISFYTFQILGYLVDVYRGICKPQKDIIAFGAYISMFPQLIAGPIVRYTDIEKELVNRQVDVSDVSAGIRRFVLGLGKKVLLANALGEFCMLYKTSTDVSVLYTWLYAGVYALHVYYDFSGYSDMAIGLGRILGFHFMENFNYPFISKTIAEFWRRWHISLGSWFRDYVYIPLGGNRVSFLRWIFNILVVWSLTGLWHGAAWNFVVWGLLFAICLVIEKVCLGKWFANHPLCGHVYTFVVLAVSFVIFDASSISEAWTRIMIMFTGNGMPLFTKETGYYLQSFAVTIIMACIGAGPWLKQNIDKWHKKKIGKILLVLEPIILLGILVLATSCLVHDSYNPFLYFRF